MKFETTVLNDKTIQSTGTATAMKLSSTSQAMVFQMFTGGLYSDPIGTVIREITSNCFDSHVEANVNTVKNPVVVKMSNEVSGRYISFIDKGVGMSPDRVNNIYGVYFESTKRMSNEEIGGYGLGGKTPLAYTSSFFLITRFEGIEYTYNVFEGNEAPQIELMSQQSTHLKNGTEVKVPVKDSDVLEFEKKTLRQLYYFENIVFEGFQHNYVQNEYNIVKGKNFLYRGISYDNKMHVCLGKVAYPIDYEALGLNPSEYGIPVAINLAIGELEGTGVTPSREALKYTPANRKIIIDKMNAALKELKDLLVAQMDNVRTIDEYYSAMENYGVLTFSDKQSISIKHVVPKEDLVLNNFKYKKFKMVPYNELVELVYNHKMYGKKLSSYDSFNFRISSWGSRKNILYTKGMFNRVVLKQSYLNHTYSRFHLFTPIEVDSLYMNELSQKFGLSKPILNDDILKTRIEIEYLVPKKEGEKLIAEFIDDVKAMVEAVATDYDELVVPQAYIDFRKNNRSVLSGIKNEFSVKFFTKYYGSRMAINFQTLYNMKGRIYYGFNDDKNMLSRNARTVISLTGTDKHLIDGWDISNDIIKNKKSLQGIAFIQISKANEKYMKLLGKKALHIDNFYNTFVARKLNDIIQKKMIINVRQQFYNDVHDYFKMDAFKMIDTSISDKVSLVKNNLDLNVTLDTDYLDKGLIYKIFNVDIDTVKGTFKHQKELDWLIHLTNKNKGKLQWIEMPHFVDPENENDQHLISLVNLCIDK